MKKLAIILSILILLGVIAIGCTQNTLEFTATVVDIGHMGEYNALVQFDNGSALPISLSTIHWVSVGKTYHLRLARGNSFTTPSNTWYIRDIEVLDDNEPSQQ